MVDIAAEIVRLKTMAKWPDKRHLHDIFERRIFALEHEIEYANPFNDVNETLFDIVRTRYPAGIRGK